MPLKTDYQLQGFLNHVNSDKIFRYSDVEEILSTVRKHFRFSYSNQNCKYYDVPCSFDIETTNITNDQGEKCAYMYIWQFNLYGETVVGRTWGEFVEFLNNLSEKLDLSEKKRLLCYVHFLEFEFQFFRKWFTWKKVFSGDGREVMYALSENGVEFRCSYKLSGYSLENVGKNLTKYKRKKAVGFLDYDKIRHSNTLLSENELKYCVEDVKVVACYIAELIEERGGIAQLPLTKTGFARTKCRNACFYELDKYGNPDRKNEYKRNKYRSFVKTLKFDEEEFAVCDDAYAGGFVHGNPFYYGQIVEGVTSMDLTSDYPSQALKNRGFPMSKGERYNPKDLEDFEENLDLYACIFTIEIRHVEPIVFHEFYISKSKTIITERETCYNGRIVRANRIVMSITEVDYSIIKQMYTWDMDNMKIIDFYRYRRGYLPTDLAKVFLELYEKKTTLKGVIGSEVEYMNSKEILNSASYGMFVTNPVRDDAQYLIEENRWPDREEIPEKDVSAQIKKYNNSPGRFSFFLWGVYISAFARRDLFTIILNIHPQDYCYCDTDSVKLKNAEKYNDLFAAFDFTTTEMLKRACDYHKISYEKLRPTTVKGIEKPLGVWDFDGHYARFKFNRAKCYCFEYSHDERNDEKIRGKFGITVAGLGKIKGAEFLSSGWAYTIEGEEINSPFEKFSNGLFVPPENTGKLTHTYIDEEREGKIVDYLGNPGYFYEKSCVHLGKCEFSMSIADKFCGFLRGVVNEN